MDLEEKHKDNILIIKTLNKRLDAHSIDDFKSKLSNHIKNNERAIVLDISEIDFIDSSGLGAIVSILKIMKGNGDIVICGASDTVMRMFKLTRMNKIFNMFENEKQAEAALQKEYNES